MQESWNSQEGLRERYTVANDSGRVKATADTGQNADIKSK